MVLAARGHDRSSGHLVVLWSYCGRVLATFGYTEKRLFSVFPEQRKKSPRYARTA